ncbi:hypothetical protein C823_004426 [Eubacterium plexicaudatum ASF492]|nr:hypothetical protein C823_004426 [Eubacterium plexicaudatum ASF492]
MSVGEPPHVILGQEMLKPRDGNGKDEGGLTGGKRLIQRLKKRHGHFADLIVADALYLNAPFISTVLSCGMETVIRLKDEKRLIFKDAQGLFEKGAGKKGHSKGAARRLKHGTWPDLKWMGWQKRSGSSAIMKKPRKRTGVQKKTGCGW